METPGRSKDTDEVPAVLSIRTNRAFTGPLAYGSDSSTPSTPLSTPSSRTTKDSSSGSSSSQCLSPKIPNSPSSATPKLYANEGTFDEDGLSLKLRDYFKCLKSKPKSPKRKAFESDCKSATIWDKREDPSVMEGYPPSTYRLDPLKLEIALREMSGLKEEDISTPIFDVSQVFSVNNSRKRPSHELVVMANPPASREPRVHHIRASTNSLFDLDHKVQNRLAWWLMVGVCGANELTPFRYHAGADHKPRPVLDFLVALCGGHVRKTRLAKVARHYLYTENSFTFAEPCAFIRFLSCIGPVSTQKLNFQHNIRLTTSFFKMDARDDLERLWLLRWTCELIIAMKEGESTKGGPRTTMEASSVGDEVNNEATEIDHNCRKLKNLWKAVQIMKGIVEDPTKLEDDVIASNELSQVQGKDEPRPIQKTE